MGMMFTVDQALTGVPVNVLALIDDTDFKTKEEAVAYNESGMDLVWNFVTKAGVYTQTAVTPTTGGDYDWTHKGNAMYSIEMPASGGASINNDSEGFGWFTGVCDGVLPWGGPIIQFSPANVVDSLVDGSDYLKTDEVQNLGIQYGFTGEIQAVTADTPSAGITRITIQDPGLDEDAADQINNGLFFLVDRSQQKVVEAMEIGDYDSASFYVFVDDGAVTPTTSMDYMIVFAAKQATVSGDLPAVNIKQIDDDATAAVNMEKFFDDTGFDASASNIGTVGNVSATLSVDLEDDAITSAKFDESTAYPLEQVDGYTPAQLLAIFLAALAGEVADAGTTTPVFKNPSGAQTRIDVTTDANGNRTGISFSFTGI